jgi:hypothetical protein
MKNKTFIILLTLVLAAFSFYSCNDPVALGSRLNLDPPTVTIKYPDFMENINRDTLTISGTAKDLNEVVYLNVTIEETKKEEWKQEWSGERGVWRNRSGNSSKWQSSGGKWKGKEEVQWSIDVSMEGAPEGEYLISVGAQNNVKNQGPIAQRRVIIDQTAPVVKVILPVLEFEDTEETTYTFLDDVKPAFDLYELRDFSILDKLITREIKVQYEIKDDFSVNTVYLMLSDEDGNIFYDETIENAGFNGSIIVKEEDFLIPVTGKQYMQITSKAIDDATNEKLRSHGWFVFWPDADIPWSEGAGDAADLSVSEDTSAMTQVYPASLVRAQAYDNQSVASVTYTIYRWDGTDYSTPYEYFDTGITIINEPVQAGLDPSSFFSWSFQAPDISDKYMIEVITEDKYGNKGTDKFYFYVYTIGTGPLLVSFGGSPPGTYVLGKTVEITLNLREITEVRGGTPTLTLNFNKKNGLPAAAEFDSVKSADSTKLYFNYTIEEEENVAVLEVIQVNLNGARIYRPYGDVDLTPELPLNGTTADPKWEHGLEVYTSIEINTDIPVFASSNFVGSKLTLNFNSTGIIYKGAGEITLTQVERYDAPAVLTSSEYDLFVKGDAVLEGFYDRGINGVLDKGTPGSPDWKADESEKYILRYAITPSNTTGDALTARNRLIEADADKVIIPVVSGAVTVGADERSLVIDLSSAWGYEMRVKGVNYRITFPKGVIRDNKNNETPALEASADETYSYPGVNAPFIRVQKNKETLSGNPVVAAQPFTTGVKIDCQTPGADIYYSMNTVERTPFVPSNGNDNVAAMTDPYNGISHKPNAITMPTTSVTQAAVITLGVNNDLSGYQYGIRAEARTTGVNTATSDAAYEIAARSVIQFSNATGVNNWNNPAAGAGRTINLWIRGGDNVSGGDNSTPGFPLSWSVDDYTGIRLTTAGAAGITGLQTANNTSRYWVTWEVNVPAYFQFLKGTTINNNVADAQANGPVQWSWSKNRWAFQYAQFPLFPGSSLVFANNTDTITNATANFEFFNNWSGSR